MRSCGLAILLSAVGAVAVVRGAEVFDYTADSPFTSRHSKTFRIPGIAVGSGGGWTSDGRAISRASLESFTVYDIFPDRPLFDAFWTSWEFVFRDQAAREVRDLYMPWGAGFSCGPYANVSALSRRADFRILAGPSVQLVALLADGTPLLAWMTGLRTGVDLFLGRNLALAADLRWHTGILADAIPLFFDQGGGGWMSMRRARGFQLWEWSLSARLFFGD